jgi:hypothetical protein
MPATRIPLPHNIASRDGTLQKDAKVGNAIIELDKKDGNSIIKRPGLTTYQTLTAGTGNGIFSVGSHFLTIIGTTFYDNGVANATAVDGTSTYQFIASIDESTVFLKNNSKGYVYTLATSTLLDLSGTITTSNGAAVNSGNPVVTLSAANSAIQIGQLVTDSLGYFPAGTYVLDIYGTALTLSDNPTGTGTDNLTFTTSYPGDTVPGAVFLDGYYVVGTSAGLLYNSNVEDPTTWQAINYIGITSNSNQLVGITRTVNYIITIGTNTLEVFYDAAQSPGSPFLPYQSNILSYGAASGNAIVQMDNTIIWMSTGVQKGFQIVALSGVTPQIISNQYIERVINTCNPKYASAFSVKAAGHSLYVLTMQDIGITLVYDFAQQGWTYWSSSTNNVESYFNCLNYNNYNGIDLLQHQSNGKVYQMSAYVYEDDGNPINVFARTPLIDFGNSNRKFFGDIQVIGDKVDSFCLMRYTNDDYQTFSAWQNINLNAPKSQVSRNGQARRRAFDLLHTDNVPLRLESLECVVEAGDT